MIKIDENIHELENPEKHFPYIGILDVFEQVLTEEEASAILSHSKHISNNEDKFYLFFEKIYQEFKNIVIYNENNGGIKMNNWNQFKEFARLNIWELEFSTIGLSDETAIIGNYELSFPVYSKNQNEFEKIKEIAKECNLFIR